MRLSAFVDTGVLAAAFHARDLHHEESFAIVRAADAGRLPPLLLTDYVLAETLNFLVRKGGSPAGREALRHVEASPGLVVERVSDAAYEAGKAIFRTVDGLSFVDAVTVSVMRSHGLSRIYSFDADFDRVKGFQRATAVEG